MTTKTFGIIIALTLPILALAEGSVAVHDGGPHMVASTFECGTAGHQVKKQTISLANETSRYAFGYSGCTDASHGALRPSAEGNFGMPEPWAGNWYWGGFITVKVNGTDALQYNLTDMRVLDSGPRGSFQAVWAHPDATIGLRIMLLPGSNHVLCDLSWKPVPEKTIQTVVVGLRCYPSFFTQAAERHCQTPTTDLKQTQTLNLVPDKDTYLFYYDAVYDVAKGQGNGPCAAVIAPEAVKSGKVAVGTYSEDTTLELKPEVGHLRFALYDFNKQSNADAEAYLKAQAAADLAELLKVDFRPQMVREMDLDKFRAEATRLIAEAAEDGAALKPKVDELLGKVAGLKTKADAGDWQAEADIAQALRDSEDLFWRLRTFAALNKPL